MYGGFRVCPEFRPHDAERHASLSDSCALIGVVLPDQACIVPAHPSLRVLQTIFCIKDTVAKNRPKIINGITFRINPRDL